MDAAVRSPVLPIAPKTRNEIQPDNSALRARDVLCSTFSSTGLRKLCYPHYDLDPSTRCTLYRRYLNDIYILAAGDRQYGLKVYQPEWRTPASILSELQAIRHLAAKGIDVVLPIARKDGKWITELPAPEGRRCAVLFHWADGEVGKWSQPSHAAALGRLTARLHAAADDIASTEARPQMTIDHLIGDSLKRIRRAVQDTPALAQRCEAIFKRCRASLRHSSAQLQDWGFCHGDLYLNNSRVDADRLVLLDFDSCGFGWRLFDIASFRWGARWFKSESIAWQPFIKEYLQIRPEAASSLELLRSFVILRHLWHTAQWIRTAAMTGKYIISNGSLDDLIAQCEQIEADPDLTYHQ